MTSYPSNVSRNVRSAARAMDNHPDVPENWRDRINLNTLNIADDYHCVLGQLFGTFSKGPEPLRKAGPLYRKYRKAFYPTWSVRPNPWGGVGCALGHLNAQYNAAWKNYIKATRTSQPLTGWDSVTA